MFSFMLRRQERQELEKVATRTREALVLRRTQALLWLDDGERVSEVADRLQVSRQAVHKWIRHFQARAALPVSARVAPRHHSGRPRTVHGVIEPLLAAVLNDDPQKWGYRATVWTAPLLRQYLQEMHQLTVSRPSVSLALKRLRIRWKRPRYALAHHSPTWCQAKGGSNAASSGAPARCC